MRGQHRQPIPTFDVGTQAVRPHTHKKGGMMYIPEERGVTIIKRSFSSTEQVWNATNSRSVEYKLVFKRSGKHIRAQPRTQQILAPWSCAWGTALGIERLRIWILRLALTPPPPPPPLQFSPFLLLLIWVRVVSLAVLRTTPQSQVTWATSVWMLKNAWQPGKNYMLVSV